MERDFWIGRWERGETGWHQDEVEVNLVSHFRKEPGRVLVPLCGKSLDLAWLVQHGHTVHGAELSEKACRDFFAESGIAFREETRDSFRLFLAERLTIWNGDFFALSSAQTGEIDAIYDRAALIALPPAMRPRYAAHLQTFGASEVLQIVIERPDDQGPPFTVKAAELASLYGKTHEIHPIGRSPFDLGAGRGNAEECVYRFNKKG